MDPSAASPPLSPSTRAVGNAVNKLTHTTAALDENDAGTFHAVSTRAAEDTARAADGEEVVVTTDTTHLGAAPRDLTQAKALDAQRAAVGLHCDSCTLRSGTASSSSSSSSSPSSSAVSPSKRAVMETTTSNDAEAASPSSRASCALPPPLDLASDRIDSTAKATVAAAASGMKTGLRKPSPSVASRLHGSRFASERRGMRRSTSTGSDHGTRSRSNSHHAHPVVESSASKVKKVSSVETRRAYALSVKTRMAANANVNTALQHSTSSGARRTMTRKRSMHDTSVATNASARSTTGRSSIGLHGRARPASSSSTPNSLSLNMAPFLDAQRPRRDSMASSSSSVSSKSSSSVISRASSTKSSTVSSTRSPVSRPAARPTSRLQRVKSSSTVGTTTTSMQSSTSSRYNTQAPTQYNGNTSRIVPPSPRLRLSRTPSSPSTAPERAALQQKLYTPPQLSLTDLDAPVSVTVLSLADLEQSCDDEEPRIREEGTSVVTSDVVDPEEEAPIIITNDMLLASLGGMSQTMEFADLADGDTKVNVENSPLSEYVKQVMQEATQKIEEKWKARFVTQQEDYERALARERERASASQLSSSRLVSETKHEHDDALKALRDENAALLLENKQGVIERDALRSELAFMKHQLEDQDELRANSFWQKTTDLAKQNRGLTEELTVARQQSEQLRESVSNLTAQCTTLRTESEAYVSKIKDFEMKQEEVQDALQVAENKCSDERQRREQFEVNVEQLTVENTALYAQMVALQTTHEAKMEELRASFEKRNVMVAGEMRALQTQNLLMRRADPLSDSDVSPPRASDHMADGSTSPADAAAIANDQAAATSAAVEQLTDELLAVRKELVVRMDQITELEKTIAAGELKRRKMHNMIQELRGNVRVHVRLRPFLRSDGHEASAEPPRPAIRCDTFGSTISTNVDKPHTFAFDKIYGQAETQESLFGDVSDFIQSAMDGYNVCIFAYGQTGSGKTHTMQGSGKAQMQGIMPRAIQLIIQTCLTLQTQGWAYTLDVTFYEIYNETIRDLLASGGGNTGTDNGNDRKFAIRTDKRGRNYVEGLTTVRIDFDIAEAQVDEIVTLAARNRSVDKTDMNAHSSRSHSIFALSIRGINEAQQTEVEGTLSLVDLAGSERLSRSNATGDRLKEAQAINKSLSAMADVFQSLAKKSAHVPYRNSKLTYALQPALSGDGKTLMMVNLSPTFASLDESVCSLRFAQNVSQCELGAPTRQIKSRASTGSGNLNAATAGNPAGNHSSSSTSSSTSTAPGNLAVAVPRSSPTRPASSSAILGPGAPSISTRQRNAAASVKKLFT